MRNRGSAVDEGRFEIFHPEDCAKLPRCWANNPTTPYGFFLLPMAPGEPDPDPAEIGPTRGNLRSIWRLLPNEAVVFIGITPPQCPYFSFTHYIFSRFSPELSGPPPYDDRVEIFASLGDSVNNVTIQTSATESEEPYGRETALIITSDAGTERLVRQELAKAGMPDGMVNTLIIPQFEAGGVTPLARMGYSNEADTFGMLMRIAHFDAQVPGTAIRNWLEYPGGRVFRVRPRTNSVEPHDFPPLRPEGTGDSESADALQALVRGVLAAHPAACVEMNIAAPAIKEDGYFCIEHMVHCYADCRDTPYMAGSFRLGPAPEAIIIAGANHEMTGKAAYVNITVTRVIDVTAFYSVVMRDLVGSADVYIPGHPGRDSVWQVEFARQCDGEPFCFEVTEEQVPLDSWLMVVVRAYLEPATGTSARAVPYRESEVVFPRMIKLNCGD